MRFSKEETIKKKDLNPQINDDDEASFIGWFICRNLGHNFTLGFANNLTGLSGMQNYYIFQLN